jgi:hypothetical protein
MFRRSQIRHQIAQTHRANLRENLQRRIDIARAKGDETLLERLAAEAEYIG